MLAAHFVWIEMAEILSRVAKAAASEGRTDDSPGHLKERVVLEDMSMEVSHAPSSTFASSDCCDSQLQPLCLHQLLERLEAATKSQGPSTMGLCEKHPLALVSAGSS